MTLRPHDFRLPAGKPPLLVGREREFDLLGGQLNATFDGNGGLILLSGEAGIGKSALALAFAQEAIDRGAILLYGRVYDSTEARPYGLWVDLFAQYTDMIPHQENASEWPPVPVAFAEQNTVAAVAGQAILSNQVLDFVRAIAARAAAVIILDDVHWSDPASLDVLRFVARALPTMPVLLIATFRSNETARDHALNRVAPLLLREAGAIPMVLNRLTNADLDAYIGLRYALLERDAAALGHHLHARTEGNPFFVNAMFEALEDEGTLKRGASRWVLSDLGTTRIPPLVRQVIDARLLRLGNDTERLLAIAAVIGHEVPLDVWGAVSGTTEEVLLNCVERAIAAHVLEELPNGASVQFAHALIRDALLGGMLRARRRTWHRQIAEALLTARRLNPHAVAHHLAEAGDDRAAFWLTRAGEEAMRSFAWVTAAEQFGAALSAMDAADAEATPARGWLLYCRALALRFADPRAATVHLAEALRIGKITGDRALRAGATFQHGSNRYLLGEIAPALEEAATGADLLNMLSVEERALVDRYPMSTVADCNGTLIHYLAWVGRAREAISLGEQFFSNGQGDDDSSGVALGNAGMGLGVANALLGHVGAADAAFARSVTAFAHHTRSDLGIGFSTLFALIALVIPYLTRDIAGRTVRALAGNEAWQRGSGMGYSNAPSVVLLPLLVVEGNWTDARPLAEAICMLPLLPTRQLGMSMLGPLAHAQGDEERARELVREMLPDGPATEPGTLPFLYAMPMVRLAARLALDAGDHTGARAWLEMHDQWLAWNGAVLGRAETYLGWAIFHRASGDRDAAVHCAREGARAAEAPVQPLALLAAYRLLGELETEAQNYNDAMKHLDAALALANDCAIPYERILTMLAQAELRAVMGARAEARALLDSARTLSIPLGAKPALARIDALGARVAARSATHPTGLTQREIEVVRLLAAGYSNRAIGDALTMSVRTAERHLNNIYIKTNARGRADATAFALRHGLADPPST